jgi:hypothetical protein
MTIGGDTNLYRSAASILKTDDAFQAASYAVGTTPLAASHLSNGTTGTGSVMLSVSPTTTGTLTAAAIALSGTLTIGGDANLYRSAANVLKTDDAFQAASYAVGTTPLAASHLSNGTTGTGAVVLAAAPTLSGTVTFSGTPAFATTGMTIGGDVNLYRGAANQLKSDDALVLVGAFSTDSTASVGSFLSANTATPANTVFVGATASGVFGPGLAFGSAADVNIYRSAANILKTDDNFQAGVAITAQAGQAGAVTIGTSSVTPTIALGSRVIYNDGSNGVRTDSHYYANGNVYAQGSGGGTVSIGRVGPGVTYGIRLDDDGCILYRAGDDVTTCSGEFRAARFVAADGGDTIIRDASGQDLTFAFDGAQFVIFRNGAEFKRF